MGTPRALRSVDRHERAPRQLLPDPGTPEDPGQRSEDTTEVQLGAAEAATMLGVTEDAVAIRQRLGELPARLTWSSLQADCLDEFRDGPETASAPGHPAADQPAPDHHAPDDDGPWLDEPTLGEKTRALARGARAASTHQAYDRDLARFTRWCAARGRAALPASAQTVALWLADQAPSWRPATAADPLEVVVEGQVCTEEGLRPATLARRLAAIAVAHRTRGLANPAADPQVRAVLAGIRRHPGVAPPRRRRAVRTDDVHALLAGLDPDRDAAEARDTALILIGYTAALRRSDLARLDLDDLTVVEDGLEVRIRRSKTDQYGTGAVLGIAADDAGACPPADAWQTWRAHLARAGILRGPAWRPIHRSRQDTLTIRAPRLSGKTINTIVARRAAQAGLDGDYGAHSLRRGFATEALAGGSRAHDVMHHGRWRSMASLQSYVEAAGRFDEHNPTRRLGLNPRTAGAAPGADPGADPGSDPAGGADGADPGTAP